MALLGKKMKSAAAMVIIAVLSLFVIIGNLTTAGRLGFIRVYGIGAAAGLLVSIIALILIKRRVAHLRIKNLLLTLGGLIGGAALLSISSLSELLVGEKVSDTGMLIINYALCYLTLGVAVDAIRVFRAAKRKESKR